MDSVRKEKAFIFYFFSPLPLFSIGHHFNRRLGFSDFWTAHKYHISGKSSVHTSHYSFFKVRLELEKKCLED